MFWEWAQLEESRPRLEPSAGALAVFVWLAGLSMRRTCGVPALADRAPKVYHAPLGRARS